ncbi:MAG TPA: DNA-formamidopyrimidine glycosylase family protein [Acidimicrobiales bacterium]|nr:DNA-formamidopyrimidine glycosylase family protein [Acidimicrobiales bacterium]
MPEPPDLRALVERLAPALGHRVLQRFDVLACSTLTTASPPPADVRGHALGTVGRRGDEYLVLDVGCAYRVVLHLGQRGRLDLELPARATRPRGALVRLGAGSDAAKLVRERGRERGAGCWVLGPGDAGPLSHLDPEPGSPEGTRRVLAETTARPRHSLPRDQRPVAGLGRGYADDILHRAARSPVAPLRSLGRVDRLALVQALDATLEEALARARARPAGAVGVAPDDRFVVHDRTGQPRPRCAEPPRRVASEHHGLVCCPPCQTGGPELADRRLSRLLR